MWLTALSSLQVKPLPEERQSSRHSEGTSSNTAPLISTSVLPKQSWMLQLHAPSPSLCCGSLQEGRPLAFPHLPGKLLAELPLACSCLPGAVE